MVWFTHSVSWLFLLQLILLLLFSAELKRTKMIEPGPPKTNEVPVLPFGYERKYDLTETTGLRSPMDIQNGIPKQVN